MKSTVLKSINTSNHIRSRSISSMVRDESGTIAVLSAVLITIFVACVGMSIDYARALNARTKMQSALDVSVLAAATIPDADVADVVKTFFSRNYRQTEAEPVSLNASKVDQSIVEATASASVETTLLQFMGIALIPVHVKSVAKVTSTGKACITVLDESASQALLVNSGADILAPDCEIHVRSNASPAAIFNSGTDVTTAKICIKGKDIIDNGGTHPNLELGCNAVGDPYNGKLPVPNSGGCTYSHLNHNGGVVDLRPGVYCGWHNFNSAPTVDFAPGVYVIKDGGWNVNGGTWRGDDVTFYFADTSKIQFNSAVDVELNAPTSGEYSGILMYEAPGLPRSHFILNDSLGFRVTDLIYLPSRDVTFNSASHLTARKFTLIVNTLILNHTRWRLDPGNMAVSAATGGGAAVLVE